MKQSLRGTWVLFIALAVMAVMALGSLSGRESQIISNQDFYKTLDNEQIVQVMITQNQETPTGQVRMQLQDGSIKILNVSDVNEYQTILSNRGIDFLIGDVQKESVWITMLPWVGLSIALVFAMIFMMNMRAGSGGGTNAKMMNFGKSRARVIKNSNVTFK